ncbi:hypothetical protein ACKWTF_008805 [Chironomus riparius]
MELLNFWRISIIFGLCLFIESTYEKHLGFYFSHFNYTFDERFMNINVDMSMYKKNTKKHPIHKVPEVKIKILQDIPRVHIQLIAEDLRSHKTLANRTIDLCDFDDIVNANIFFKSLLNHLMENLKFMLKCPFKKGTYVVEEHSMPNYAITGMMKLHDKYHNIQKVKTKIDNHIKTIFESSYTTEVCEFD